jgi:hypothetical protein
MDICKSFNDQLQQLVALKIQTQTAIFCQELSLIRLARSLLEREVEAVRILKLEAQIGFLLPPHPTFSFLCPVPIYVQILLLLFD